MREFIKDSIEDSIRLKQEIYQSQEFLDEILRCLLYTSRCV